MTKIRETINYIYYSYSPKEFNCLFTPIATNKNNSTKNVVFMFSNAIHKGILLSVASLRKTNNQCTVVLFTNLRPHKEKTFFSWFLHYMPLKFEAYLKDMNVEIISIAHKGKLIPHQIRYECEREWLKKHINDTENILHIDAFDSFFQGDPFANAIDGVTFIGEGHPIKSCSWNRKWVETCFNEKGFESIKNKEIVCSGTIIGNAREYLRFLDVMLQMREWETCKGDSLDQAFVNYAVYSGILKNKSINYRVESCSGDILTMSKCMVNKNMTLTDNGLLAGLSQNPPLILHQYNRYKEFQNHLEGLCIP